MTMNKKLDTQFTQADIHDLDVELKVGILATVTDTGLPHMTMISSLRPYAANGLVWGQFTEGLSKGYIQENPKAGFLIMSLDKQVWRGTAHFTHTAKDGLEYENYNNLPMFRYNAYFGVHTVYYMDLLENSDRQALPMGQVVYAAVTTILARTFGRRSQGKRVPVSPVLNPWVRGLLNKLDNLKFLSYIREDGYPVVLPVIQTQVFDTERVIFSTSYLRDDLSLIPAGIPMAVFGMSFDMEDVLLRGVYQGIQRVGGVSCGLVEIDWVYNSMPPKAQQIYPPVEVTPVVDF